MVERCQFCGELLKITGVYSMEGKNYCNWVCEQANEETNNVEN